MPAGRRADEHPAATIAPGKPSPLRSSCPSDQHCSLPPAQFPCLCLLTAPQTSQQPPPAVIRQVQRLWVLAGWSCCVPRGVGSALCPCPSDHWPHTQPKASPPSPPHTFGHCCLPPNRFLPARCDPRGAGAARPHLEVWNRLGLALDVSQSLITACGPIYPSRNRCFLTCLPFPGAVTGSCEPPASVEHPSPQTKHHDGHGAELG